MEKLAHHRKKEKKNCQQGNRSPGVNSKYRCDQKFPPSWEPRVQCVSPISRGQVAGGGGLVVLGAEDMTL